MYLQIIGKIFGIFNSYYDGRLIISYTKLSNVFIPYKTSNAVVMNLWWINNLNIYINIETFCRKKVSYNPL